MFRGLTPRFTLLSLSLILIAFIYLDDNVCLEFDDIIIVEFVSFQANLKRRFRINHRSPPKKIVFKEDRCMHIRYILYQRRLIPVILGTIYITFCDHRWDQGRETMTQANDRN